MNWEQIFPPHGEPSLRALEKNELAAFRADGACIEENALAFLEALKNRFQSRAPFEMLATYCLSESATYAAIGSAAGVTSQRAAQNIANGRKRAAAYARRKRKQEMPPDLEIPLQKMQEIFTARAEDLYTFALYGAARPRLFCMAAEIFYGNPFSRYLYGFIREKRKNSARTGAKTARMLENVKNLLCGAYGNSAVTARPAVLLPHLETGEPIYPDFLLEKEDGGRVLILVRHSAEIAAADNLACYNSLHLFCRECGYAYMILDENGGSLHKLKQEYRPCELFERLESLLAENGCILKSDADCIGIDSKALAVFILHNRLRFTLSPWKITKA